VTSVDGGQDKIQSNKAVMSVASPDLDGLEINSKLIHVAAADVWGLLLTGRGWEPEPLGARRREP